MHAAFSHIRFANEARAEESLTNLIGDGGGSLAANLAVALGEAGDASRVLVRLEHWLEAAPDRREQLTLLQRERRYCRLLCRIFDHSQMLTDIIMRLPENMAWLWQEGQASPEWQQRWTQETLRERFDAVPSFGELSSAMRQFYRKEILRIGVRDIFVHASVESVTRELANLADAMLQVAVEGAERELNPRYGTPRTSEGSRTSFAVLGMGKLGGRELNFSSDIDLIFLFSGEGQTDAGTANSVYYTKLGELVIRSLSDNTAEGHIFRVDMRLRPHGRTGPLASTVGSTIDYFSEQAQPWERQALIKARPCAGDLALGASLLETLRPVIFPRYFDDETLEDIRDTKRQIESLVASRGETDIEVKLGRGGIRDIEFTVQMLQLLNGGQNAELRAPGTLDAIDALGRHGLLAPFEAQTLASNYSFLRHVEHRLQIEGGQQRHALPKSAEALEDFARRLGYESGGAFLNTFRERQSATRSILERFFATEGAGNLWISRLLNPREKDPSGVARLERTGFQDPAGARAELLDLCLGPDARPHSAHIRHTFRQVAPLLLSALEHVPNPDEALLRLGQMLVNVKAPSAVYDILRQSPALAETLVTLVSNSRFLSDFIIRDPDLFETLGQPDELAAAASRESLEAQYALLLRAQQPEAALYRLRNAQTLRIGLRDLMGLADVLEVGTELTMLAEFCIEKTLKSVRVALRDKYGGPGPEFAVVGLGKLGGQEMGYGSDLDLLFVYRDGGDAVLAGATSAGEYAAAMASGLMNKLMTQTRYGTLYDVDARLRPDGQKGPLAVSLGRIRDYYAREAQAWERLALVKARVVVCDETLQSSLDEAITEAAYSPLTASDLANIEDVRARLAAQSGPRDIKRGEGGIAELEFAVRLLQIRHGENPGVRAPNVVEAIQALSEIDAVDAGEASRLRVAYGFLRRIENRLRMREGRGENRLPGDGLIDLAARLGFEGDFDQAVEERRGFIHSFYRHVIGR